MARLTIAQLTVQLEQLRTLCSQQETRIRCDAETIRLLKFQIDQMATTEKQAPAPAAATGTMTMGQLSMRYCREKGIRVCTVGELHTYALNHGIEIVRSF